ncbi:MAG: zinc-binding dehydrogenase [Victivallales bacterium]|nr:zinc-binding dehydrogenase [Victivallales bacterium]
MKVKAVVFSGIEQIEIRELELAEVKKKQIRTETLYSFVSPGTELRTLGGHYGASRQFPIVPGYSTISRIVEVGPDVRGYRVGDIVSNRRCSGFLDCYPKYGGEAGGHVFEDVCDDGAPVILPEEAKENPLPYTVAEVAAISYRGAMSTEPATGEHAIVIGQGMIGAFAAEWLRLKGCLVTVCDISENRLEEARSKGFNCVSLSEPEAEERLLAFGAPGYDIVAECSGSASGFQLALRLPRPASYGTMRHECQTWPRLLLQATYIDDIPINPCAFFKGEGIKILTPNDRTKDDRQQVVELIRRKVFDTSANIKNVFAPEEMPDAYRKLQRHEIASAICKWKDF